MQEYYTFALISIILIMLTAIITKSFVEKSEKKHHNENNESRIKEEVEIRLKKENSTLLDMKYKQGYEESKLEAINHFKGSEEFKTMLENERHKGFETGKNEGLLEERQKLKIEYQALHEEHTTLLFMHKVTIGYSMQVYYSGFPIGNPIITIISTESKLDDRVLSSLIDHVEEIASNFVNVGIKAVLVSNKSTNHKFNLE